ncbi:hypothetical protein [Salinicola tamaricis]|uniref:hypothetical protein n=1 Tax=Salinicola tamaricis TaxID=1771309 RepID=UPI000D0A460E|nr:hypothetical protein [Salinicola tamaricis]
MTVHKRRRLAGGCAALGLALAPIGSAQAYELLASPKGALNLDVTAVHGWMDSRKNYAGRDGGSTWREGYIKYGFSGHRTLGDSGELYGALDWVSSATWGDGDAGGNSLGSERRTSLEEAYLGWRSGDRFPFLGTNGLDLSAGRQVVQLGRGFIINDDGLNLGKGPAGGALDRGGAYYLAPRHAFARTAVARIGGEEGLHGTAAWLESDNRAQADTELLAGTLDYTGEAGTVGLTAVHGLDVNDRWANEFTRQRDGMNVYSLRGESDLGVENAAFAAEYARQYKRSGSQSAWYAEASYTFAELAWTPTLTYRYTRYAADWDSLFTGQNSPELGTWFQGEVAANYAGIFARNTAIQHLGLRLQPTQRLSLGALFFDFTTLKRRDTRNLDARELDLYASWMATEHIAISPLVGFYTPDKSAAEGGSQVGGNGTNVYAQLVLAAFF